MDSFAQEIQGFSKSRLKKQCTHVTTVTGKRHVERRVDGVTRQIVEIEEPSKGFGFVEDKTPDLQVGVVRPFLLLGKFVIRIMLLIGCYYYITYCCCSHSSNSRGCIGICYVCVCGGEVGGTVI